MLMLFSFYIEFAEIQYPLILNKEGCSKDAMYLYATFLLNPRDSFCCINNRENYITLFLLKGYCAFHLTDIIR